MNEELDKLVRREFGLGAAEHPQSLYHCADPRLPQMEFEWHPNIQKVYRIDLPGKWLDGEFVRAGAGAEAKGYCIAEHCLTHAMFLGHVQTFCRGYLKALTDFAQTPPQTRPHGGSFGALLPDRILQSDPCPVR